jgi:hypothetical protein
MVSGSPAQQQTVLNWYSPNFFSEDFPAAFFWGLLRGYYYFTSVSRPPAAQPPLTPFAARSGLPKQVVKTGHLSVLWQRILGKAIRPMVQGQPSPDALGPSTCGLGVFEWKTIGNILSFMKNAKFRHW